MTIFLVFLTFIVVAMFWDGADVHNSMFTMVNPWAGLRGPSLPPAPRLVTKPPPADRDASSDRTAP